MGGVIALLMAAAILAWMAYNLLVELQPEVAGQPLMPPIVLCIGLIYVAIYWIRGKVAK